MSRPPKRPPAPDKLIKPPGTIIHKIALVLSGCGVVLVIGGLIMWHLDQRELTPSAEFFAGSLTL